MKTKNIFRKALIFTGLLGAIIACQPDKFELGTLLSPDDLEFSITQNPDDPNMIYLESLTPGVSPLWQTPMGRSTLIRDTVKIAFAGEYNFIYGVQSPGGYVEADTFKVTVTTDNFNYVSDQLWTLLTGGVGESKTWILDNGQYGLAVGPLSYADPSREQGWGNFQTNWDPDGATVGATDADYQAEMTFDLIGGPHIITSKPNESVQNESGVFAFNNINHTLGTTNATIIRVASFIANVSNWTTDLNILVLTENQLRISVMRTNAEGPWWYILNYVSKEYAENYVPGFEPDPNFDHGDQMLILAGGSSNTWKLSPDTPFNWTDLNGAFLNPWYSIADYPDWTGFNQAAVAGIENLRLTFTRTGDVMLTQNDGTTETGTFSLEEKTNLITFNGFKPSIYISGGWVYATTTDFFEDEGGNVITGDNQWKLVKTKSVSGITTDIWFGKRDTAKKEYMVCRFVLDASVPDITREVTRALCGGLTGQTQRTFKLDVDWPVDWRNPLGEGWTVSGTQADWYWNDDIKASVVDQRITFMQVDGVITATKINEQGAEETSSVQIDAVNRMIIMPGMDIIKFGADSWLNTTGPNYNLMSFDFQNVETSGIWLGVKTGDTEYTSYRYIIAD